MKTEQDVKIELTDQQENCSLVGPENFPLIGEEIPSSEQKRTPSTPLDELGRRLQSNGKSVKKVTAKGN